MRYTCDEFVNLFGGKDTRDPLINRMTTRIAEARITGSILPKEKWYETGSDSPRTGLIIYDNTILVLTLKRNGDIINVTIDRNS